MRRDDDELEPILDGAEATPSPPSPSAPPMTGRGWRQKLVTVVLALALLGLGAVGGRRLASDEGSGAKRVVTDAAASTSTVAPVDGPPRALLGNGGDVIPFSGSNGPPGSLEPLGTRTTLDGVMIRSYRPKHDERSACGDPDWCPPQECQGRAGMVHAMSTDAAVGFASSYRRAAVLEPTMYVSSWGVFGVAESAPVLFATVVAREHVQRVVLVLDGYTDTVGLLDGESVVAIPLTSKRVSDSARPTEHGEIGYDLGLADVAVLGYDKADREVSAAPLVDREGGAAPLPAHCERPAPPLPAPGEQPADPAWSRDQVRLAYRNFWSPGLARSEKLEWLTDAHGVEPAMARAAENYPQATGSTAVEIGDIVFISPVQAQLHFRLVYTGAASLGHRTGMAAFVDGRWKVSRSTVCEILSIAGGSCLTG